MRFVSKLKDEWLAFSPIKADILDYLCQSNVSHITSYLLAILFAVGILLTNSVDTSHVCLWFTMITITYIGRMLIIRSYRRANTKNILWLNRFRIIMMISGLVWASSIPLLFQSGDITNQTITIFVLTGLCAGAILSYGIDYFVLWGILLPITLTLFASLVAEGSHESLSISVMVVLFLTFAIALSRKSNKDYIKNITLARAAILGKNREKANANIMEMIAQNESLDKVLVEIVRNLEQQDTSMLCSILLLDNEGKHLRLMAAPSLPDFYNIAIDGIAIGPDVGCCGAAAYTGERVIAEDILSHPNWRNYTELATKAHLRACWSEPIKDAKDALLGTFAIYHTQPTIPSETDIQTITHQAALVGIAVGLASNYQEQRLAALLYQNTTESMMITDSNNTIIAVNPAFTKDTGYRDIDVIGKNPSILKSGRQDNAFYDSFYHAINTTGKWQGEIWNRRKNGEIYPQCIKISTIYGDDGEVLNRVCLATDVTNKKQSEELIWRQANFDSLTGLPNRHMFHEQFQQEIKKTQRSNLPLALFFIDLDEFKEVNDTLGHHMGDLLLKETGQRLCNCIRESDTTARLDTVARLGGDEFTIILSELNNIECVVHIAQRILERIAEPYHLKDEVVHVSASIGITLYPNDSTEIDTLLKNADQAMYAAKSEGKNRFSYFTSSMQAKVLKRMALTKDLRNALAKQQFHLVYQPIVNLSTNKVMKAEALIRWHHPTKGLVSPAEFIPIAESTGLINKIGDWVFFEVIEQEKLWRQSLDPDFQISINKGLTNEMCMFFI